MMGTLGACNVVGFAPGFAIGIAQAILVHLGWSALDSVSSSMLSLWSSILDYKSEYRKHVSTTS